MSDREANLARRRPWRLEQQMPGSGAWFVLRTYKYEARARDKCRSLGRTFPSFTYRVRKHVDFEASE